LLLAWAVGRNDDGDIHWTSSTDQGRTFGAPRVALSTDGYSDAPKLAVAQDGRVHLAFAERPGGMFAKAHVRYAHGSVEGAELSLSPARRISDFADEEHGADFPHLAVAGDRVHVAWEHHPHFAEQARGMGMTLSRDGGQTFLPPRVVPATDAPLGENGRLQGKLMEKLHGNEAGRLALVNSRFQRGEGSRVRLFFAD